MTRSRIILVGFGLAVLGGGAIVSYQSVHRIVAARSDEERLRELRYYLLDAIKDQTTATRSFPATLALDDLITLESGRQLSVRSLLTRTGTDELFVYRGTTPDGDRIAFDPNDASPGERFIVWSPTADASGRRTILTDSLLVKRVPDAALDFEGQTVRELQ